jgi:hypothetical protein
MVERMSVRRAVVRLVLGLAQMFGAALSLTLLLQTGINRVTLIATAATSILTTASLLLFGRRGSDRAK